MLRVPDQRHGGHGHSLISQLELCQEGGVKKGVTWRMLSVLIGHMDDRVIHDVMNDILLPKERFPENFIMIS